MNMKLLKGILLGLGVMVFYTPVAADDIVLAEAVETIAAELRGASKDEEGKCTDAGTGVVSGCRTGEDPFGADPDENASPF